MPTALPTELVKEIQDLLIREVDRGIVSVRGRVFLRMTAHHGPTDAVPVAHIMPPLMYQVTSGSMRPVIMAHIGASDWNGLLAENGGIFTCSRSWTCSCEGEV